jgi:hypothetical protein
MAWVVAARVAMDAATALGDNRISIEVLLRDFLGNGCCVRVVEESGLRR